MRAWVLALAMTSFVPAACGGSAKNSTAPARSPTLDYPPPAQETSQGEVMGADRVQPGDKLRTGPSIGTSGPTPAERPSGPEKPPAAKPPR